MEPQGYGNYYYCIKTDLSKNGEIYVHAESVQFIDGCLMFLSNKNNPVLVFAPGTWRAFYAASVLSGDPVAIVHWKGEIE